MNTIRTSHYRTLLLSAMAGLSLCLSAPSHSAPISAGSGLGQATKQSTGIYHLATVDEQRRHQVIALAHKGKVLEIHAKTAAGGYLKRGPGSTAIRVSPQTFTQLISIAGGMNRDIESLSAAKKNQFYALAGLSTSASQPQRPLEVTPGANNTCPSGYGLKMKRTDGGIVRTCEILSYQERNDSLLAALTNWWASANLELISPAHARLLQMSYMLADFFHFSVMMDNGNLSSGDQTWRIRAAGFDVLFTTPMGP